MLHTIVEINSKDKNTLANLGQIVAPLVSTESKRELWGREYSIPTQNGDEVALRLEKRNNDYLDGKEESVPSDVMEKIKWLVEKGISFKLFRKVITDSCPNAIKATEKVFENCENNFLQPVCLSQELKQMVLLLEKKRHNIIKYFAAVNIPADHRIVEVFEGDKSEYDRETLANFYNSAFNIKKSDSQLRDVTDAKDFVHGENDPLAFHLRGKNENDFYEHNFSEELFKQDKLFFNLGNGTWRVELSRMEFVKMFNAICKEQTANYKINVVRGITAEEGKEDSSLKYKIIEDNKIGCKIIQLENQKFNGKIA